MAPVTSRMPSPIFADKTDATFTACVEVLAKSISMVQWGLYDIEQGEQNSFSSFRKCLLVKPNKLQNAVAFWKYMERCRWVYGNAYAYIHWADNGTLQELIPLDPRYMKIYINDTKELEDVELIYEYKDNKRSIRFLPDEILHFKANSQNGIIGIPTAEVLSQVIEENALADSYMNEIFKNGFSGVMTLSYVSDLNTTRRKELIEQVKKILSSQGARMLAIPNDVTAQVLGNATIDSSYTSLRERGNKEIAGYFGVPLFMLNQADGNGTSAMTSAQSVAFYNSTIAPIVKEYATEMTAKFLTDSQIRKGTHFENADINGFTLLSASERIDNYVRLASAGILTVNETRKELGFIKYKDENNSGDLLYRNGAFTSGMNGDHDFKPEKQPDPSSKPAE